jgi:arginyl-tRNA synthetase
LVRDPLADFDAEIYEFLGAAGVPRDRVALTTPADRQFGERSTNVAFQLAKERRMPPRAIAGEIAGQFDASSARFVGAVEPAGAGFLNFRLNYERFTPHAVQAIGEAGELFGRRPALANRHVVVEHTSVNPNKEWHIGHVRNAVLGDVVTRLFRLVGHDVQVQNYIDDTGLQAATSIFGLQAFPEEPRAGEKYDHYAGRAYVKISAELAAEPALRRKLEEGATEAERFVIETRLENIENLKKGVLRAMHALEEGEFYGTIELILNAQLQTAYRLGIYYDLLNWESHLVQSHLFEQAMDRLRESPKVSRPEEGRYQGALVIETGAPTGESEEPKREVLIRSNGLPTYVAKDIAYHMWKFGAVPDRLGYVQYTVQPNGAVLESTALHGETRQRATPDQMVNMIAVDQTAAQEAVKDGLRAGGFPDAAERLVHLPYGLVSTPEGKLSGRKGTAVSGDAVIDEAVAVALERVREKRSQELTDEDMEAIAEAVGVGAVRYFMVQYNPLRDIVFNVADVVSYDGNTGLYVQYALVRMYAILRRASSDHGIVEEEIDQADARLLQHEQEKRLIYHLALYPELVSAAARTLSVNLVAEYAFDLATIFNQFYRDCGVLNAEPPLRAARLLLVRTVLNVLAGACGVLGVPVIERL